MAPMLAGAAVAGERRRYPRTKVIESQLLTVDVALGAPGCDERQQRGIVIDLGEGGMAIQPFLPMMQGIVGDLRLDLPGAVRPFATTGMVAWVGHGGRAGIRFVGLSAEARAQLRGWLNPDLPLPEAEPSPALQAATAPSSDTAATEFDFDAGLRLVAERAQLIAEASGVAIALGDSNGMVCRASIGAAPDVGVRLRPQSGLSGYCLRSGQTVHCPDTQTDPRVDPVAARQLNLGSIIVIPVFASSQLAGLLEAFSASSHAFDAHHAARLDRLAVLLGGMIEERNQALSLPPQRRAAESLPLSGPRDGEFYTVERTASPVASPPAPVFYGTSPATPAAAVPAKNSTSDIVVDGPGQPPGSASFEMFSPADAAFDRRPTPGAAGMPDLAPAVPRLDQISPQLCDACGYMNQPGAVDCEQCDVPLPSALLRERAAEAERNSGDLYGSRPFQPLAPNVVGTSTRWAPCPPEYCPQPAAAKPRGVRDASPDHTHFSWTVATLGVVVVLITGAVSGWYVRYSHRLQATPVAVPLPPIQLPKAPEPDVTPSPRATPEAALGDEPEVTTRTFAIRPPAKPAATKNTVTSSADGQSEVRIVLSSLSYDGPQRKHSHSQLLPGRLLHKVDPAYPQSALARKISGNVELMATITKNGSMSNLKVVSGPEALRAAAVDAIRQWRYQPWQLDGNPVDVQTTMTVTFALQ